MAAPAELGAGEVHLWVASLDVAAEELATLRRGLAPDEERRAAQLCFATDRRRFIVRRGLRRAILAGYAGGGPASLRFRAGPWGKPALAGGDDLHFNCSHSGGLAAVAVTRGRRVGIDVEGLRPVPDALAVARSLFCPVELAALAAVPAAELDEAFLRCWTRKEAYLKASGEGLGGALAGASSLASPRWPAGMDAPGEGETALGRWGVREFAPGPGYVGAVASEGSGWSVRCRPW